MGVIVQKSHLGLIVQQSLVFLALLGLGLCANCCPPQREAPLPEATGFSINLVSTHWHSCNRSSPKYQRHTLHTLTGAPGHRAGRAWQWPWPCFPQWLTWNISILSRFLSNRKPLKTSSETPGAPLLFEYLRMECVGFADLLEPAFCSNTPLEPGLPGDSFQELFCSGWFLDGRSLIPVWRLGYTCQRFHIQGGRQTRHSTLMFRALRIIKSAGIRPMVSAEQQGCVPSIKSEFFLSVRCLIF